LFAVPAKEGISQFGPPRDGFWLFHRLFDSGQQRSGEGFQGEGIGTGREHEFSQLGFLPIFQRSGFVLKRLDLGIDIDGLAHVWSPVAVFPTG
jgi:hypothetical protein